MVCPPCGHSILFPDEQVAMITDPIANATEGSGTGAPVGYCLVENQPRCYFQLGSAYCPAPGESVGPRLRGGGWSEVAPRAYGAPHDNTTDNQHTPKTASGSKWTDNYISWVERTSQVFTNAARCAMRDMMHTFSHILPLSKRSIVLTCHLAQSALIGRIPASTRPTSGPSTTGARPTPARWGHAPRCATAPIRSRRPRSRARSWATLPAPSNTTPAPSA
jgi:hypothetical protein